jgi:hypothetical protein
MKVTHYPGPRLCECGKHADVLLDLSHGDSAHAALLCWPCADAMSAGLDALRQDPQPEELDDDPTPDP